MAKDQSKQRGYPVGTVQYVCRGCDSPSYISWIDTGLPEDMTWTEDNVPYYVWIMRLLGRQHQCETCGCFNSFIDPFYSVNIDISRFIVDKMILNEQELEALDQYREIIQYNQPEKLEWDIRYRDPTLPTECDAVRAMAGLRKRLEDGDTRKVSHLNDPEQHLSYRDHKNLKASKRK